ncbi:M28 family peptidase [Hufsiella ginkgonis]|uniref:M28 family peptidase n=1 Tax=Hufsiella ginkgonis TaxID=2695274 RepID=A0A7K1XV15_9SPHI|nr:M28 family peptidase [Hufsiella ginkgonis]MXV14824.1 M28 family peptidase [Hufsiella ginkgonis]
MKRSLLFSGFLLLATQLLAQEDPKVVKYAGLIAPASARKHLTILASDEFEGRETGTPGAEKAAQYLADEFKKLGLGAPVSGSHLMPVPLVENKLSINFSVNGRTPDRSREYYIPDVTTSRDIKTDEILFIGYGSDVELGDADIRGKVVLWINEDIPLIDGRAYTGFAQSPDRAARLKSLMRKGPAMILGVNRELSDILKKYGEALTDDPMTVRSKSVQPLSKDPVVVYVTNEFADKLVQPAKKTYVQLRRTAAGKGNIVTPVAASVQMKYDVTVRDLVANNILGYLEGSDLKEEVLVFSAHYDHIGLTGKEDDKVYNGADDDGSGTTALLEIAKAFAAAKSEGNGPRRSILFLANVGEEKGLLGSKYYTDNALFPLKKTVADLNMDMIGRVGPDYAGLRDSANYVYLVGPSIMSKDLKQISDEVNSRYDQLILDYKYDDATEQERIFFRSDHYNFAKEGIPVIFYSNGEHPEYHKAGDEVGKINFPLLVKRARLVFYTGWELANRDKRPKAESIKKLKEY